MSLMRTTLALAVALSFGAGGVASAATSPGKDTPVFVAAASGSDAMSNMDRYGGPAYGGPPALTVTAALVKAGGGAADFSIARALTAMVGEKLVNAEVAKLTRQYGKAKVDQWMETFDFAVKDALAMATKAGIVLPKPPSDLSGATLAATLVKAGTASDGTFWTGVMLDHAISHKFHDATMDAIDRKFGAGADVAYHAITNQAMYDVAHALGDTHVKLASLH